MPVGRSVNGYARGSLLSDSWSGTAAQLANRRQLGIYPAMGWWRKRPSHSRINRAARYSLVVSIEAPEVQEDLYANVALQIAAPVAIELPTFGERTKALRLQM